MKLDKDTEAWLKESLKVKTLEGVTIREPKTGEQYTNRGGKWVQTVAVVGVDPAQLMYDNRGVVVSPLGPVVNNPQDVAEHLKIVAQKKNNPHLTYRLMEFNDDTGVNMEIANTKHVEFQKDNKILLKNVAMPHTQTKPGDEISKEA